MTLTPSSFFNSIISCLLYAVYCGRVPYFFVKENSNVCHKHFAVFTLPWICSSSGRHMFLTNFRACFTEGGKDEFRRRAVVKS